VNDDAVENLLALGASQAQAVAALRRCGGSVERAASELLSLTAQRKVAQKERNTQGKYGQTTSGAFVDPDLVQQLVDMGVEETIAIEALKEMNNDLSAALNVVQAKRARAETTIEQEPLDDMSVAMLLSMDYEQCAAEAALRSAGGDVEQAIAILASGAAQESNQNDTTTSTESVTWQYEAKANEWTQFDSTATHAIEAAYTAWKGGTAGIATVEIPFGDSSLTVNVADMTYAGDVQAGTSRCLRRVFTTEKSVTAESSTNAGIAAEAGDAAAKAEAMHEARAVIERELGSCLRRGDMEDDMAGAALEEEEMLLQQYLSCI